MLLLVTYDVSTETAAGRKRLSRVAKSCSAYGVRVQNSVFECVIDAAAQRRLEHELESIIDPKTDSLRFYNLGNNYKSRVRHVGAKAAIDVEGVLII
jgi:CRISPR-associated protein Cas2